MRALRRMENSSLSDWTDVDTATAVSVGSSCVILLSGCIAVVCLIVYMKRSERPDVCLKCRQSLAQRRSVGTDTDALYAISSAGVICGHVSDVQTQKLSQCSQDSELIYELSRDRALYDVYESIGSERETPTDPGIRQFTESPPKPNERRQGVVQHVTASTNEQHFGALPRFRSRQPMWKLSSDAPTIKCLSSLTTFEVNGLSSDDRSDDSDDDDFPNKSIDC